jgi:hypothetical protein
MREAKGGWPVARLTVDRRSAGARQSLLAPAFFQVLDTRLATNRLRIQAQQIEDLGQGVLAHDDLVRRQGDQRALDLA